MVRQLTFRIIIVISFLASFTACGPDTIFVRPHLDTPSQHISNGNRFLENGKVNDAFREFARARELDPQNALAHAGIGLVLVQKGDLENALKNLVLAENVADDVQDHVAVQKGYERYYEAVRIRQSIKP